MNIEGWEDEHDPVSSGEPYNQLYQHIQVFGKPRHYTVRVDNDPSTEKTFERYNDALFYTVRYLANVALDHGD